MSMINLIPWQHGVLWTLTLFCLFVHSQVVIVGAIIAYKAIENKAARAARDTIYISCLSLLFVALQADWIIEGYTVTKIKAISDIGWRLFDCGVGVALLRHMNVRRCFACAYWGKGRSNDC